MANGMLGSLPPGLRGMLAAEQMGQQRNQNQLGMLSGMLGLQGQMQEQDMRQQGLAEKQQQAQRIQQFASTLPPPEQQKFMLNPGEYLKELNKKYVVNGALVGGGGGPPIYQAPPDVNKPFMQGAPGQPPVPNKPYQDYETGLRAAGRPQVTTNVLPPQKTFENEDKLRNDYSANPLVKASSEMQNAFNLIDAAYQRPSAANDLAMATKYMKILDPTSVVRESEFALAVNATGLFDKVSNYSAAILEGKKLNPTQRKDFYDSAKAINDAFQKQRGEIDSQYSEMATGYGLNPQNVIPSLRRRKTDKPAEQTAEGKTIKRTGTLGGRKVVEYSDGTIEYQ